MIEFQAGYLHLFQFPYKQHHSDSHNNNILIVNLIYNVFFSMYPTIRSTLAIGNGQPHEWGSSGQRTGTNARCCLLLSR